MKAAWNNEERIFVRGEHLYWTTRNFRLLVQCWPRPRVRLWRNPQRRDHWSNELPAYALAGQLLFHLSHLDQTTEPPPCLASLNEGKCEQYLLDVFDHEYPDHTGRYHRAHAIWKNRRALATYWAQLPARVRHEVRRQSQHEWLALEAFAACPAAADLSRSNPMLFNLLMIKLDTENPRQKRPHASLEFWVRQRQADIMKWLGLPASESNRRILSRLTIAHTDESCPRMFQLLERHPSIHRIVEHLPVVHEPLQWTLQDESTYPHLTGSFLHDFSTMDESCAAKFYWTEFSDGIDLLHRAGFDTRPIHSVAHFRRLHDAVLRRLDLSLLLTETESALTFPPPPYKGTTTIVPLTRPEELLCEGMEMKHCAAIYAKRVAMGECYLYQVLEPVRATLEIRCTRHEEWILQQLRRKGNDPVSQHATACILDALFSSPRARRQLHPDETEADGQLPLLAADELAVVRRMIKFFAPEPEEQTRLTEAESIGLRHKEGPTPIPHHA